MSHVSPSDLWIDISLRLQQLGWMEWLDLLLVTVAIFLILTALQRAQATVMLRGLAVVGMMLLVSTLFLSLPAFGMLVRIILIFLLVALPVVFQRQLRILFEDLGRTIGLAPRSRRRKTQELMQPIVRAVEQMAAERVGALIVLEGDVDLDEIAETGVAIDGYVSSELLTGTFSYKNPLHDGAVLIRGQRVVAAACVLPAARGIINGDRSLGTRHRAAVGMSQRSDALIVVVSEETGTISAAEDGRLEALPDGNALRERLLHFTRQEDPNASARWSLRFLYDGDKGTLRP
ncbi:MAG: diadenylate cyclase CdaA, partial [Candidatus Promineifilaceae bacterium]|nr:diadenylate cyclase CdaA [Candidatus Promineifilaceae bacterium]